MRLNIILCPISLLPSSMALLQYAARLAHHQQARLRILHVTDSDNCSAPPTQSSTIADHHGTLRERVEAGYVQAVPADVRMAIQHEVVVVEGDIAEQLGLAAEDHRVDLIVMGFQTTGQPWVSHKLDRVLRRVSKPVLAVPDSMHAASPGWRRILVATDLAPEAAGTHAAALALADMTGASVMVVHVIEEMPAGQDVPLALGTTEHRDIALQEAAQRLDSVFQSLPGQLVEMVVTGGDPSSEIARVAQREAADLLVVGFRPSGHHLMGTAAGRLLNRLPCPVLAVPHAGAGRPASAIGAHP